MAAGKKLEHPTTEGLPENARSIAPDPDEHLNPSPNIANPTASPIGVAPSLDDMKVWTTNANWPQPKWLKLSLSEKPKASGYRQYYLNSLRTRYLELEGDFRTCFNNFFYTEYVDMNTASLVINYLQTARAALDNDDCDFNDVTTMLHFADQNMVNLYPRHVAASRAAALSSELKGQNNAWGSYLESELTRPDKTLGSVRAALEKTKSMQNEVENNQLIANGLQIERLKTAWMWSFIVLGCAVVFAPMILNFDGEFWTKTFVGKFNPEWFRPWFAVITAAVFGAMGAFLSSLMNVRSSRTSLSDFQEKSKDNQLKLTVGAIAAIIVFTFITWDILPNILVKNAGTFLFMAFVSGFSERFFLQILKIDDQNVAPTPAPPAPIAAAAHPQIDPITEPEPEAKAKQNTEGVVPDSAASGDVNSRKM